MHKADLPLVGRRTEDADGHLAHLGAGQPRQFAPLSAPVAVEFGQPGPERASPAQLVAAESEHEEDAVPLDHPDEVSQQPEGALVGPVQVLDHEYERMHPGRGLEGAGNGVVDTVGAEPAGRTGFGWGNGAVGETEFGQEQDQRLPGLARSLQERLLADPGGQFPQRGDDGRVRRGVAVEVDRLPAQHQRPVRPAGPGSGFGSGSGFGFSFGFGFGFGFSFGFGTKLVQEFLDEPGLPDAGLAAERHRARAARLNLGEGAAERLEVGLSADERGGLLGVHGSIVPLPGDPGTAGVLDGCGLPDRSGHLEWVTATSGAADARRAAAG